MWTKGRRDELQAVFSIGFGFIIAPSILNLLRDQFTLNPKNNRHSGERRNLVAKRTRALTFLQAAHHLALARALTEFTGKVG
jgi:hypothetical protein